jgi:hypothetical protein
MVQQINNLIMKHKRVRNITIILILVFISACVLSFLRLLFIPSDRVGIFGIGLPSRMVTYGDSSSDLIVEYPDSWAFHEFQEKSTGNSDMNATINVPGRSFPSVIFTSISSPVDDITEIIEYGKGKTNNLQNLSEISLERFATLHNKGYRREYSWSVSTLLGRVSLHCEDYYFVQSKKGYIANFCAEEKHWPVVQEVFWQIMNSLIIN